MEIRPLRPDDDRLAVSRIYEESWKSAYRGIVPQSYLDGIPTGLWAANLDQNGRKTLVLLDAETPIGTTSVGPSRWPEYPDFGEIVSLYLLPEHTGQGHGLPLLTAALDELRRQGFQNALLWVLAENHRARRFYEKSGFTFTGNSMNHEIAGKLLKELLYSRPIEA